MDRDRLLISLGSSNLGLALDAATQLVALALHGSGDPRTSIVPSSIARGSNSVDITLSLPSRISHCSVDIEEVRALAASSDALALRVITECLGITSSEEEVAVWKTIGAQCRPITDAEANLPGEGGIVWTEDCRKVAAGLKANTVVTLVGESASGKSTAARQVLSSLREEGWATYFMDFNDADRTAKDFILALTRLTVPPGGTCLLGIDNIQSNSREATALLDIARTVLEVHAPLKLLLITWPDAQELIRSRLGDSETIVFRGDVTLGEIGGSYPVSDRFDLVQVVRELSQGDVLIGRQLLDAWRKTKKVPSFRQLQAIVYNYVAKSRRLSKGGFNVLYYAASLGQFEIQPTQAYLSNIDRAGFQELRREGILRQNGEYITLGHKTLCAILARYLEEQSRRIGAVVPSATDVALNFLRRAGEKQLLPVLARVNLRTMQLEDRESEEESKLIINGWSAIEYLTRRLNSEMRKDVSWGDNIASAAWCADALSLTNEHDWDTAANFIRSRWQIVGDALGPFPRGEVTKERVDFDEIYKRMLEQDAQGSSIGSFAENARNIDLDRVHRTWVLGILLGFEGRAPTKTWDTIRYLKGVAESQQGPDGSFYPRRVVWVTARVALGLAATGEDVRTSSCLRAACDWMRLSYPSGPRQGGCWRSGSGTWNTDVEVTAMVLIALIRSGIPLEDASIKAGVQFLLSREEEWSVPGKEIDSLLISEILLLYGTPWKQVSHLVQRLIGWAREEETWHSARGLASATQDQSSKAAFTASALIGLLWALLKRNIPLLLRHLDLQKLYDARLDQLPVGAVSGSGAGLFISHASQDVDVAVELAARVEAEGISTWLAPRSIGVGDDYPEALSEALSGCDGLLLLLSKHSNESIHVMKEVERAIHLRRRVYVLRLEDIEPEKGLNYLVSSIQRLDYFGDGANTSFSRLIDAITGQHDGGRAKSPPDGPMVELRKKGRLALLALGVFLALIVGIVGLYGLGVFRLQDILPGWWRSR